MTAPTMSATTRAGAGRTRRPSGQWISRGTSQAAVMVLAAGMVATTLVLWHLGRGTTFFYDEWDFVMQRRSGGVDSVLTPHNGHLSLVSAGAFRILFAVFGLGHYGVFRAMVIVAHLACCGLLFFYARRRVGDVVALAAAASLMAVGRAWEDLLWPFQTALIVSVAAGMATLCFLDRRSRTGDGLAAAALGLSLSSFSFGIPLVVGVTVELAVRRTWRRLWVPALPAAGYGLWRVAYGGDAEPLSHAGDVLPFVRQSAEATVVAFSGVTGHPGWLLLIAVVIVGAVGVWRRRSLDAARVAFATSTLLAFWCLTALTRATRFPGSAGAGRYLYIGVAYLVVLLVELGRGGHVRPITAITVVVAVVSAAHSNSEVLRAGAAGLRDVSTMVKAELAAVEIAGDRARPDVQPDPQRIPQVRAGEYLAAVHDLGSPRDPATAVRMAPAPARQAADAALLRLVGAALEPSGERDSNGRCTPLSRPGPAAEIQLPPGAVRISAGTGGGDLWLRRFGAFPESPFGHLEPGESVTIVFPEDKSPMPWLLRLSGVAEVEACPY